MSTIADGAIPPEAAARADAGLAALDAGEFDEAIGHLTAAARLAPTASAIGRQLGEAQAAAGDLAGARATLEAVAARTSDDPAILVDLAHVCQIAGDSAAARAAIERAAALQPDSPAMQIAQARLYEAQGEGALAAPLYESLARAMPTAANLTQLARVNLALGRYREADAAFRQLALREPEAELMARHGRIWCQIGRGDWRSALEQALGAARADRYELTTALLAYARDRLFTRLPQAEIERREAELAARFTAELREEIERQEAAAFAPPDDDGEGDARD